MNRPASSPDLPGTGNDTSALSRTGDNEPLLLDVSPAKGFSIMLVLYCCGFSISPRDTHKPHVSAYKK